MGNSPKHYLEYLINNPNDRKAINHLIETSFLIAKTYLKMKYFSDHEQKLKWSENLDDIAMDAIVPLFIINGSGKLGILRALDNWKSDLKDNPDTLFFLNRVIWKRVEQTIIKLIKQKDPIFSRIHKNLSTCIATHPLLKINYLGKTLIVRDTFEEITGLIISDKQFEQLPAYLFEKKQYKLCNDILNYLENETSFFPAIPMNQLVKKIKLLYFANKIPKNSLATYESIPEYTEDIFTFSLQKINDKIYNYYHNSGKLTKEESDAIAKSFEVMTLEMRNGGLNYSIYEYLKYQMSDLTKEDFYKNYHGIMNYLLSDFKKSISKLLKDF